MNELLTKIIADSITKAIPAIVENIIKESKDKMVDGGDSKAEDVAAWFTGRKS